MVAKPAELRVDPRVTRTQNLIRDALRALLKVKSFESISVQDIAERATVNRATFYAHFTDKFALLDAIVREDLAECLAKDDPIAEPDPRKMLEILATCVFAFVSRHRQCKVDKDFEPQFERAMEAELRDYVEPRIPPCAAFFVASAIVGMAMQWRASGRKEPMERVSREIVDILSDGVGKHVNPSSKPIGVGA
jgi:AcrR family transcriptional regulator